MFIDLESFLKFLNENHIIATIIATIISTHIVSLSNSLTDDILLPILCRDADGDGIDDIEKYQKFTISIFKINFKVGNFLIQLFKFLFITYSMFIISKNFKSIKELA